MSPLAFSRQPSLSSPVFSRPVRGFSLIEMLVVIAIIGILAAILVPMITRIGGGAEEARHRRNAQTIATTYISGIHAGAPFLVPGDIDETIDNIVAGATVQHGVFAGQTFRVPGLSELDRDAAARYLILQDDRLTYRPQG